MATTRIIPLHASHGETLKQCLSERLEYGENPEKTNGGELVTAYGCTPGLAAAEFALAKREYVLKTGRTQKSDVIAYQIRQSFRPGEITPEEANRIGREFADRFTKGRHAFVVCTHTDRRHIHNHIYWNSTSLDCSRKFRNFWGSTKAVRDLSDMICVRHGLSVIKDPMPHGKSYPRWLGENNNHQRPSHRELLRQDIDETLAKGPDSFDDFLRLMEDAGYRIKKGKSISFGHPRQKQNIRLCSLGPGYSESELRLAIGKKALGRQRLKASYSPDRPQLVSGLEAKRNTGRGRGYDLKITNEITKQQAKALLYYQQHGFRSIQVFDRFSAEVDEAGKRVSALAAQITAAEKRLKEIGILQTHIINYSKTRAAYIGYRKAGYSKKYFESHEEEIQTHRAAKHYFDQTGMRKLPTIRQLRAEYAELLTKKKADYADYYNAKAEYRLLLTHRANLAQMLQAEDARSKKRTVPQHE